MPMSMAFQVAQFSKQTGKVVVPLLSIDSDEMASPLYITGNEQDLVSNGELYYGWRFDVILPDESSSNTSSTTVTICNVNQQIDAILEPLVENPDVTISWVLQDTPDIIEVGPATFVLEYVASNVFELEGNLSGSNELDEIIPKDDINPTGYAGSF